MRPSRRLAAVLAACAVALSVAALASLAPGSPLAQPCAGAGRHSAALVVEHGDGSIVTRCVSFASVTITGEQLLDGSGVGWSGQAFGGYGVAVCAVDGEPAHYATCPGKDRYWALFVSRGGGPWQLASVGISTLTLDDGDAEGLRYVPAAGTPSPPPAPAGACDSGAATGSGGAGRSAAPASGATATPVSGGTAAGSAAPTAAGATAGATDPAIAAGSAGGLPHSGAANPASGSGSGIDPGLLAAAMAGGGLAGLALLRLAAARRRAS